jgi:hypothetical protein
MKHPHHLPKGQDQPHQEPVVFKKARATKGASRTPTWGGEEPTRGGKEPTRGGEKPIKGREKQKESKERGDRDRRGKGEGGRTIASSANRAPKQGNTRE